MELPGTLPILRSAPPSRLRTFAQIRDARIGEYGRHRDAGQSTASHIIDMPDDGPFGLIAIGDPHWDDAGTDLADYERWTAPLAAKRKNNVHGILLGDLLNNWVFPKLAKLYGEQETGNAESWILAEGYLKQIAHKLIASCSGNHDDWSSADLLGYMMEQMGILHRPLGIKVVLRTPAGHEVSVYSRHRWPGNSQWNAAHGIMKAAQMGRREDILLGGDKHVSGEGYVKCPVSGRLTHCYQVASFKKVDDYGDELGLPDKHATPAVGILVDPARPFTDKQRVTTIFDPEELEEQVKALRKRKGFP